MRLCSKVFRVVLCSNTRKGGWKLLIIYSEITQSLGLFINKKGLLNPIESWLLMEDLRHHIVMKSGFGCIQFLPEEKNKIAKW